jgi:hypothetical protein
VPHREETLAKLNTLRQSFCFSLGAYALLTQEPARSQVSRYDVCVTNNTLAVVGTGASQTADSNMSYRIVFNSSLPTDAALTVVRSSFYAMLSGSFEAMKGWDQVEQQDWFHFARHLRNAISHNGRFHFTNEWGLPAKWRNLLIEQSMQGAPVENFLGWFDGLQLNAVMNIFVSQGVKT